MKNNFNSILFLVILSTLLSCTKVLDIELDESADRVIIEGIITNEIKPFQVKLSRTLPLGGGSEFPKINNAFVTISDDGGNLDTLSFISDGLYQTNGDRQGIVGRTYFLSVVIDGKTYVAQDKLFSVPAIDSLYFVFLEPGAAFGINEAGYYAFYNTTDNPNEKNYYYFEVLRNNVSVLRSNQLGVYDDRFLAPVILASRIPGKFNSGDKLNFNFYSLSEPGFNFYNGIALQLQNDGGFFGTPPANAPTNVSEGALGFFQASSIVRDSLIAGQ